MTGAYGRPVPGEGSVGACVAEGKSWEEEEIGEFETEICPRRCRRDLTGEEKVEGTSRAGERAGVGVGTCRVMAGVRGKR